MHEGECNCKPVGQILDNMGLVAPLEDGEIITNAVVILTVAHPEKTGEGCMFVGDPGLGHYKMKGMIADVSDTLSAAVVEESQG